MSKAYWLRHNDRVVGPCDAAQLVSMAKAGMISPNDMISADQRSWQFARDVKGLFPVEQQEADRVSHETSPSQPLPPPRTPRRHYPYVVGVVAFYVGWMIVAVIRSPQADSTSSIGLTQNAPAMAAGKPDSLSTGAPQPSATPTPPVVHAATPSPNPNPCESKIALASIAYWNNVAKIREAAIEQCPGTASNSDRIAGFHKAASDIRALSPELVDEDTLRYGLFMAKAYDEFVAIERQLEQLNIEVAMNLADVEALKRIASKAMNLERQFQGLDDEMIAKKAECWAKLVRRYPK